MPSYSGYGVPGMQPPPQQHPLAGLMPGIAQDQAQNHPNQWAAPPSITPVNNAPSASPYAPATPPPTSSPYSQYGNRVTNGGGGGSSSASASSTYKPVGNAPPSWQPDPVNQYGGQQIAGANPSQAEYGAVQNYADDAYAQARRYLDPQQDFENKRFEQDLINKGIDPNSEYGQMLLGNKQRGQNDANNAAAFASLQFGQGIQDQMAQQEYQKSGLAGDMQKALWQAQLGGKGLDMDAFIAQQQANAAAASNATNARANQLQYDLGMSGLDLNRAQLDWTQQMDIQNLMLDVYGLNNQQQMYRDILSGNALNVPIPGATPTQPNAGNQGSTVVSNTGGIF